MATFEPSQPQNPHYATFALNLACNENLLMVLNAGSTAQARRRRRSASFSTATPSTTAMLGNPPPPAVSDGYQSSDDSLHLPPSSRQRCARANTPFLPPLPGHSASPAIASARTALGAAAAAAAAATPSISVRQIPRRNSASSTSSAFSWQESIFHVRRLSDAGDGQTCAPGPPCVERVGRLLVPPPRHGSRPHPNPLRSNPVFEGGRI